MGRKVSFIKYKYESSIMTFMSHIIYHVVQDQVPVPPFEYSTSILMLEGARKKKAVEARPREVGAQT